MSNQKESPSFTTLDTDATDTLKVAKSTEPEYLKSQTVNQMRSGSKLLVEALNTKM